MKALGMVSGGLDSRLAVKLMQHLGFTVEAFHAKLPFAGCSSEQNAKRFSEEVGVKLNILDCTRGGLFKEYLAVVRHPKHGYGSGINPCIDCRIFVLKKARVVADRIKAKFIFTGEVLGERPMSQMGRAIKTIEEEAGLKGKLLRPLSAKLLPETEVEQRGWVNRKQLLAFQGRSRKPQIELASKLKLKEWPNPGGGCLLCEKVFSSRLRDLFKHNKIILPRDVELLKLGRHFRINKSKIVVGRNEAENKRLVVLKRDGECLMEVPGCGSPVTLLQGDETQAAAKLTARYSDAKGPSVSVSYGTKALDKEIIVSPASESEVEKWRA